MDERKLAAQHIIFPSVHIFSIFWQGIYAKQTEIRTQAISYCMEYISSYFQHFWHNSRVARVSLYSDRARNEF